MHPHQQEDNDAWFSRGDRFDGFDRGDNGRESDPINEDAACAPNKEEELHEGVKKLSLIYAFALLRQQRGEITTAQLASVHDALFHTIKALHT